MEAVAVETSSRQNEEMVEDATRDEPRLPVVVLEHVMQLRQQLLLNRDQLLKNNRHFIVTPAIIVFAQHLRFL